MSTDTMTNERARRALTHGGGIDGILFLLMAAVGVGVALFLLIAGMQTAETQAERAANHNGSVSSEYSASEIGAN